VPDKAARLAGLREVVASADPFTTAELEARASAWLAKEGIELKDVAQPARVALTGRSASPGLYEVMEVLGKERSLARLDRALARLAEGSSGAASPEASSPEASPGAKAPSAS
jgi:glutamyl-tRNA synthetase